MAETNEDWSGGRRAGDSRYDGGDAFTSVPSGFGDIARDPGQKGSNDHRDAGEKDQGGGDSVPYGNARFDWAAFHHDDVGGRRPGAQKRVGLVGESSRPSSICTSGFSETELGIRGGNVGR